MTLAGSELSTVVFRTANALLANPSDAEELTLDVLVRLHDKLLEQGDEPAAWLDALPGWLDRVTVSKAKGRAKKGKRHAGKLEELALLYEQLDETSELDLAVLTKEVLAYLPRKHRFVLVLEFGLGHDDENLAELLNIDPPTVKRAIAGLEHKLREFAEHDRTARKLHAAIFSQAEDNPLEAYIAAFGAPDEVTEARIERRFQTYLESSSRQVELTGEHGSQLSGFHYTVDSVTRDELPPLPLPPDPEAELPDPTLVSEPRGASMWTLVAVIAIAAIGLTISQLRIATHLGEIDERLDQLELGATAVPGESEDQLHLIEPGSFVELAHGSRAEASKDSKIELVRNDGSGAEFRVHEGWIALHVKRLEGVDWVVHDGRYRIVATGTRFKVTHTGGVPQVEVFEGRVEVSGGVIGPEALTVSSGQRTLAAALAASGKRPLAEANPELASDDRNPDELAPDELFERARATRSKSEAEAEALFRKIIERGDDDWISERSFEELRTLVAPSEREALRVAYVERFPDGAFAEAFEAIECQTLARQGQGQGQADAAGETDDAEGADKKAEACWTRFAEAHPDSLYGP